MHLNWKIQITVWGHWASTRLPQWQLCEIHKLNYYAIHFMSALLSSLLQAQEYAGLHTPVAWFSCKSAGLQISEVSGHQSPMSSQQSTGQCLCHAEHSHIFTLTKSSI